MLGGKRGWLESVFVACLLLRGQCRACPRDAGDDGLSVNPRHDARVRVGFVMRDVLCVIHIVVWALEALIRYFTAINRHHEAVMQHNTSS